jgi:hypothetical protein
MSLASILRIGDKIVCTVGFDDTVAVVCGLHDTLFYQGWTEVYRVSPGVYHVNGAVSVLFPDGRVVSGVSAIEMVDRDEQRRRHAAKHSSGDLFFEGMTRLGDLPETLFWVGDKVRVRSPRGGSEHEVIVRYIDYYNMHKRRDNGSPYPFYIADCAGGGSTSAAESQMTLIERGPVWKYHHGEPLEFSDIWKEAGFFVSIGKAKAVANPASGLYSWTQGQVLDAVREGLVHTFSEYGGDIIDALRLMDEELGGRVAEAILEKYSVANV